MPYLTALQRQRILRDGVFAVENPVLDLDPAHGPRTVRVRPVGLPYGYVRYSSARPKKSLAPDGSVKVSPGPHPFPDDGLPKDERIGLTPQQALAMGVGECPYAAKGYAPSSRWAMNVLEVLGPDLFQVRVLDGPRSVFEPLWGFERANQERNQQEGRGRYVEDAGGALTHLFDLVVTPPRPRRPHETPYHMEIGELTEISESEIQALAAVGEPTNEELARLRSSHPDSRAMGGLPDWTSYGHPLHRMFAPHM